MTPSSRDRALLLLATVAGLVGMAISIYLTFVHFLAVPLVCSASGAIDCERVLASPYSVIGGTGLPTSVAGIAWFAISASLAFAQVIRPDSVLLPRVVLAWTAAGLACVVLLVFMEIVLLGAICIWCTAAHALVLLTFLLALSRWQTSNRVRATDPG
jgi:uncharacterized membrane protein